MAAFDFSNYKIEPNFGYFNENDMKTKLVQKGPIAVDLYADTAFYSYTGGIYNTPCPSGLSPISVNHGVLLVGYGFDPAGGKYWKAKNR